jgi:acyl carrier protein
MEQQEIMTKMKVIIAPYTKNTIALSHLDRNSDFTRDLEINSVNLVDIVLDVEETFDIEIDNEAMEHMLTVGAAMDIVENKLAQR